MPAGARRPKRAGSRWPWRRRTGPPRRTWSGARPPTACWSTSGPPPPTSFRYGVARRWRVAGPTDIGVIADAVWDAQVTRIAGALVRACAGQPALTRAVVTGLGEFLAAAAARRVGLQVTHLSDALGPAARHAPAAAVALLFPA